MIIELQKALVDSLQKFTNVNLDSSDQSPRPETIGMIVGVVLGSILIIGFFIFVAYYFPWFYCYNLFCHKCVDNECCNCIRCYFMCPCMETKAFEYQLKKNQSQSKVFIQDLLTTPDGRIIHLSDFVPIETPRVQVTSPKPTARFSESDLI